MKHSSSRNRWLGRLQKGLLGAVVFILIGMGSVDWQRSPFVLTSSPSAQAQPAQLRRIDPSAIAARIYEQMPALPLENQYISSKTGQVAADNTLVSRMIRYHLYSKERPTNFRFDWKLTLADYLGAFDRISADNYADYGLRENPIEADVAVIRSLSQEARNQLVSAIYVAFTSPVEAASPSSAR
ncbi:MAG: hypothetical protein WA947_12365 [Phormidesmis sp.]